MRHRESGSSQIPLVICIVLLLIAGFFAYSQSTEREAAEVALKAIRDTAKASGDVNPPGDGKIKDMITFAKGLGSQQKARLEDIAVEVGARDEGNPDLVVDPAKIKGVRDNFVQALDKGEFVIEFPLERFIETPDGGVKVQEAEGKAIVNYARRELALARPELVSVIDVIVVPAMRRMVRDIKTYRDAYVAAVAAKETAEAQYRTTVAAKDAEIRAKVEEYNALESRKAQEIADLRRQKDESDARAAAAEEEKNQRVAALTAELAQAKKTVDMATSETKILKQRKRAIEEDVSPDGRILTADETQSIAVVNIGRSNNNLMPGTNFDVYGIAKGGREVPKGVIKISKVDGSTSTAAVVELFDVYNPIVQGDYIRSKTYSPTETIHVALVGRFSRMGKSDAARRLEALGVVVDPVVGVDTHFLVVGAPESETQPIEETPEFKAAQVYNVQLLTEKELGRMTMY
ncbi:MAG: hypothetical protein HUU06_05520 [Planctomycetaceae bacterium]|nr:hypothetical protein [Planctomycetota bacterium]NUN52233.1 hypothetical protein [Planctomycetaceae bacterium]